MNSRSFRGKRSPEYLKAIMLRYERVRQFRVRSEVWSQFGTKEKRIMSKVIRVCYDDCIMEGLSGQISRLPI